MFLKIKYIHNTKNSIPILSILCNLLEGGGFEGSSNNQFQRNTHNFKYLQSFYKQE